MSITITCVAAPSIDISQPATTQVIEVAMGDQTPVAVRAEAAAAVAEGAATDAEASANSVAASAAQIATNTADIAGNVLDISILQDASEVVETAGTGNAYTLTYTPVAATLHSGQRFTIRLDRTNTDAVTLNVDAQGVKDVQRYDSSGTLVALEAGQWVEGQIHEVSYDGTRFVCLTPVVSADWRSAWHPYDATSPTDGTDGLIYDSSVDGSVSSVESGTVDDGYDYWWVAVDLSHDDGSNRSFRIGAYKDTSAAWENIQVSDSINNAGFMEIDCVVNLGMYTLVPKAWLGVDALNVAVSPATIYNSGANRFIIDVNYEPITNLHLKWAAGNIDGGKIYLFKRKVV